MTPLRTVFLSTLADTTHEATALAHLLRPGDLLLLAGDLGVGKTAFARGLIQALAEDKNLFVPSPTFNLVHVFDTPYGPLWHVDLYRLTTPKELETLGLEEAFMRYICLVEWPDRLTAFWQSQGLQLHFSLQDQEAGAKSPRQLVYEGDLSWKPRLKDIGR